MNKTCGYILVLMVLDLTTSCYMTEGNRERNDSDITVVSGEIRQSNTSDHKVWVEKLLLGTVDHRAGVLMPGSFKHMGFARLVIGAETKLEWIDFPEDKKSPSKTVYFDSSKLQDVAKQIRYMKFTYTGDDKWMLQVYDRSETTDGYSDDKFLKQIVSQIEPAQTIGIGGAKGRPLDDRK